MGRSRENHEDIIINLRICLAPESRNCGGLEDLQA